MTIDTKETTAAAAKKRAQYVLRHTIARRRFMAREKLIGKGLPVPDDLRVLRKGRRKPGTPTETAPPSSSTPAPRPRKVDPPATPARRGRPPKIAAAAPPRPELDHEAIAERLRTLNDAAAPPAPPLPTPAAPPATDPPGVGPGELGEDDDTPVQRPPIPAADAPPLPDPETSGPEVPEVVMGPPSSEDGDLFAGIFATLLVAGYIKGIRTVAAETKPPIDCAEPHAGSLRWLQEGLEGKIRTWVGDRTLGDGTKIVIGALGVGLSMVVGGVQADTKAPAADGGSATTESDREGRPPDAANFDQPQPRALEHANGTAPAGPRGPATGKFR